VISYFSNFSGNDALLCEQLDGDGNYCCRALARYLIKDQNKMKKIFCPFHATEIRAIFRGVIAKPRRNKSPRRVRTKTSEIIAKLLKDDEYLQAKAIAEKLDVSVVTVYKYAKRMGWTFKRKDIEFYGTVAENIKSNKPDQNFSTEIGAVSLKASSPKKRSRTTQSKYNLNAIARKQNENKVKKYHKHNLEATAKEIAHHTQLSQPTVNRHLRNLGLGKNIKGHVSRMRLSNKYVTRRR
jgi:hypothetical protein